MELQLLTHAAMNQVQSVYCLRCDCACSFSVLGGWCSTSTTTLLSCITQSVRNNRKYYVNSLLIIHFLKVRARMSYNYGHAFWMILSTCRTAIFRCYILGYALLVDIGCIRGHTCASESAAFAKFIFYANCTVQQTKFYYLFIAGMLVFHIVCDVYVV